MKSRRQRSLAFAILCLGLADAATSSTDVSGLAEKGGPGIVIEEVGKGSALEGAGLRPGDVLLAWERSPDPPTNPEGSAGEIRTVFDWFWVKVEQAPRGTVRLRGERSGAAISLEVPRGVWEARTRPRLAADLLQIYREGRWRIDAGDLKGGIAHWDPLVYRAEQTVPGLRCWLLLQISGAWSASGQGDRARAALQAALAEARDAQTKIVVGEALGESYQLAGEMARAESSFRSALEVGETAWGESLQVASSMTRLGNVLRLQSRLDAAAQLQRRALEIRQRWAPDSLEVADSLHQLFWVAVGQGDLDAMSDFTRRALTILERWPPDSLTMADTLNDLGVLALDRGQYAEAVAALQRSLVILEQRSPESLQMATSLGRLGLGARLLGDVEAAEEALQHALAIRERLAPVSLGTSVILSNLGMMVQERGDLAAAAKHFERALAISERAVPNGVGVVGCLNSLGTIARLRGDLDAAWRLHQRALEIGERLPNRVDVAFALSSLGRIAEARGDLKLALGLQQRASAIYEQWAPSAIENALTLQQLGRLYRRMERPEQAAQFLTRAVDALESQVGRLGGSQDLQATYRARHEQIYRDAIAVALERGHAAEAFHLLERSRARSFLTLLAERDLAFSGELPAALERSRRDNAARYDQILRELARWTPAAGEEAKEAFHRELSRLRRERDEIAAEIRKASPRLAALRQPQPLDLAAARKALDPGTIALSYSIGTQQTVLFAVTREGEFRVEILKIGEERLRRDVELFLERIQMQDAPVDLARSLYRTLIGPVADLVERSERVLILPDGPLHRLPFGALIRGTDCRQYLAEWKPLHTALSLTVYGTLRASEGAPSRSATAVVAFGDPRYPQDLAPKPETRGPLRRPLDLTVRSFNWEALPYSRREVERLAAAYPEARLYLGEEATEERAKSVGRDARVLHFATHAYFDDRTPLDSALVLTIPEGLPAGRDNGLLQVWEILESVRLDADLVVLSACESALGRELSGEGLIGLTRAFQYAGARSVVATLWGVADQVTAELMARFHRHLATGLPKDEALRAAQIELIREPVRITTANGQTVETDASAPFFWAAFQLFGDWR
ncbi:MAG TPA: CHAT domain-containing protein [Thermoanaerobaculia bacterium]|jgi:CHAT domain-containing protein/Tfp pilus assembly protein PilF